MTYIDMLNKFYDFCEQNIVSSNAQLLFYKLLQINNKFAWKEWFRMSNKAISEMIGVSENTFKRCRNELKDLGLIDFSHSFKNGHMGTITEYCITYNLHNTKSDTKSDTNVDINIDTNIDTKSDTKSDTKVDTINRYKTKTKKEKDISKDISKKKFVPPTAEEVKEYCDSRNNSVDPEKFVDFYASKGWMVGKNKMKDWKAAVRTWEHKSEQEAEKPKARARPKKAAEKESEEEYFRKRAEEIELHNIFEPDGSRIFGEIQKMFPNLEYSEVDSLYDKFCVIYNTRNLGEAATWEAWKKECLKVGDV